MSFDPALSRKEILTAFAASLVPTLALGELPMRTSASDNVTIDDLRAAERIAGLEFSEEERAHILRSVQGLTGGFTQVRGMPIRETSEVPLAYAPTWRQGTRGNVHAEPSPIRKLERPTNHEDLAFLAVHELAYLIRKRELTSVELTNIYLDRLQRYGDRLLCVVTLSADLAMSQAEQADREIAQGHYRGPLHGIPYGAKDLFATRGIPTTWGADPFKHQMLDYDAAVVERLRNAGAVLLAKLSIGALAQGDVWFRGQTKNPWNLERGSSGSSAGSAAATAAGLVAFGIGTETSGSILSPSLECRVTGLRPTFGRVSRYGAMELCYSLDRIGPICREAEDCALVLAAIAGADPRDPSAVDRPFYYPARVGPRKLKVGWVGKPEDMEADPAVHRLQKIGATVEAVKLTPFPNSLYTILNVESASAFDAFTRGEEIHALKHSLWPDTFRAARYVPAVEYLQAQRARALMTETFEREFGDTQMLLGPGLADRAFGQANFSGYPAIVIPFGEDARGNSLGRTLIGRPYEEAQLLTVAKAIQDAFTYKTLRPKLS